MTNLDWLYANNVPFRAIVFYLAVIMGVDFAPCQTPHEWLTAEKKEDEQPD